MNRRIAVALAVLMIGSVAAAAAPAGATSASIKVTPSKQLSDAQTVHVTGKNFNLGVNVVAVECVSGATASSQCDESTTEGALVDGGGKVAVDVTVRHRISTGGGPVDCGSCAVFVGELSNFFPTAASRDIKFATAGTPQKGAIAVPMSVPDGGIAEVQATGFAKNALIETAICTVDPQTPDDCSTPVEHWTDGAGSATVTLIAPATITTANSGTFDCSVTGACEFVSWDSRSFFPTRARAFDVVAPQPGGTLVLEQSSGLHDGDVINVSGTGWDKKKPIRILECNGLTANSNCNNIAHQKTASDGSFSLPYTVKAVSSSGQSVNCLTGPCWIVALRLVREVPVFTAQRITFAAAP